jgi:hypothetical protein
MMTCTLPLHQVCLISPLLLKSLDLLSLHWHANTKILPFPFAGIVGSIFSVSILFMRLPDKLRYIPALTFLANPGHDCSSLYHLPNKNSITLFYLFSIFFLPPSKQHFQKWIGIALPERPTWKLSSLPRKHRCQHQGSNATFCLLITVTHPD